MRDNGLAKALVLATQLGFAIACPMVVFIGGGAWLDAQTGWGHWFFLVGTFLGLAAAGGLFYQLATLSARRRDPAAGKAPYKVEEPGEDKDSGNPPASNWKSNGR
jgi:putative F0F1-ATPase subunit (Ca2+/Mg2+ transporter)